MLEPTTTQTPPAAPAFDPKAFGAELIGSFKTQLEAIVKPLQDELAALKAGATPAQAATPAVATPAVAAAAKPLTLEDVKGLLAEQSKSAALNTARDKFIAEKMQKVPAAYLPGLGDDPNQWPAKEQEIRAKLQADLKALGITAPNLGGETAGTGGVLTPAAGIDMSKLTSLQKIELGLKNSKPARPPSTTAKVGA